MVVDVDCAVVEAGQKPGFRGVEIDTFDAIRSRKELFLHTFVRFFLGEQDIGGAYVYFE